MGFTEIPYGGCLKSQIKEDDYLCRFEKYVLDGTALTNFVQENFAPGGYYRNTENLDEYKNKSKFLPNLNNEVGEGTKIFN
jgi:cyanate lyase